MSDDVLSPDFFTDVSRLFQQELCSQRSSPHRPYVSDRPYFVAYMRAILKLVQNKGLDGYEMMRRLRVEVEARKSTIEELLALQAIVNPDAHTVKRMQVIVDQEVNSA